MEVYILDSLNRPVDVVDNFVSFIWTERFSAYGDFELQVASTFDNRARLVEGKKLAIKESYRVMTIDTVEDNTDEEGRELLIIKGNSLEIIMDKRLARGNMNNTTTDPTWIVTGTPKQIASQIFHDICVSGILDIKDAIPGINEGSIFPADTITPPSGVIQYAIEPKTLYQAEKDLCDLYFLGFRIVREPNTFQLYFDVYSGSDRTSHQTTLPAVIFSTNLDNLYNTSELRSIALEKTVAYVISPVGCQVVYATGADTSASGFDRKVLFVQADDITDTDPLVSTPKLIQRGMQELSKNKRIFAFDGELKQDSSYLYGRDYNLGDLVEQKNKDGVSSVMQVTEQIFVSDAEGGDRAYPTLVVNQFVTPGSWLALPADKHWADYTTEHWADM